MPRPRSRSRARQRTRFCSKRRRALCDNKLAIAERILKDFLKTKPTNVAAIRMLAEVAARLGRYGDAETLLARCLALAPRFTVARHNYAVVLNRQNKSQEALAQVEMLLREEPNKPAYRALKGAAFGQIGEYAKAIACYESVLKTHSRTSPRLDELWPHAEGGRPPGRLHRRLPQDHRTRADAGRSVLEPRQSQDVSFLRRRHQRDARSRLRDQTLPTMIAITSNLRSARRSRMQGKYRRVV